MAGTPGATSLGNTRLVGYGIQNENSHVRTHVCPRARRVYIYPTECGIEAIGTGIYPKVGGRQRGAGFVTAEGYLVPPFDIRRCVAVAINDRVWEAISFRDDDSTTEKGQKAVCLVIGMLKNGLFPFPALAQEITDADLQIDGADVTVTAGLIAKQNTLIQVKCDFPGGERELGGTGHLFLQVAECNPFNKH